MLELPLKDDAIKAAIDFLEKQGYSVLEWHEFDADDKNTWPENGTLVAVKIDKRALDELKYKDKTYVADFWVYKPKELKKSNPVFDVYHADDASLWVTHWQPLPIFKDSSDD